METGKNEDTWESKKVPAMLLHASWEKQAIKRINETVREEYFPTDSEMATENDQDRCLHRNSGQLTYTHELKEKPGNL